MTKRKAYGGLKKFFLGVLGVVVALLAVGVGKAITDKLFEQPQPTPVVQATVEQTEATPKLPVFTREELLRLTNEYRVEAGRRTLLLDPVLNDSAQRKCEDMAASGVWDHDLQEFQNLADALNRSMGENLAYGFPSVEAMVQGWVKSPSHYDALINKNYSKTGFGVCNFQNWIGVVQHFSD